MTNGFNDFYDAGVEWSEIVLAQLIHQFFIMVGQAVLIFIFVLFVFNIPIIGSLTLAIFLSISQGFCGMCLGRSVGYCTDQFIYKTYKQHHFNWINPLNEV